MNHKLWRSLALRCLMLVAVLIACLPATAQQTLGALNGTVLDPSGAAVGGAKVTATNAAIHVSVSTTTQATGFFQIFNLPIGRYVVKIQHAGFEVTEMTAIQVQEARTTTVNASLKVGQASESVVVTGTPLLNATDTTNGYTMDASQIALTPLPTGSFTGMAALSPGVNTELGSGVGTNTGLGNAPIWANGQRDTSNTFQVNGVDVTNLFNGKSSSSANSQRVNFNVGSSAAGGVGTAAGGLIATGGSVYASNGNGMPSPPPEFTEELRVNTSMYDAQQGATSGAQIDVNTKSGSNAWHGQVYGTRATNFANASPFFYRQDSFLYTGFPSTLANPELHRWTGGATAGGPIKKDKLFFFGSYQHLYDTDQSTGIQMTRVPSVLTSDRTSGGLLSAFNVTSIDPVALALLQAKDPTGGYLIPTPNLTTSSNNPNVVSPGTSQLKADQASASLDYDVTRTDRLSAKYYYQHDPYQGPHSVSNANGFPTLEDSGSHVGALDNTISIGPRINWEQRVGIFREKVYSSYKQTFAGCAGDTTCGMSMPDSTFMPGLLLAKFGDSSTDSFSSFTVGPSSSFIDAGYFQNRLNPSTNVIFSLGKHTIVAGGGYSYTQLNIRNNRSFHGQVGTKNLSSFLAGKVKSASMTDSIGADGRNNADRYYRSNELDGYVQDKYQALPNLSLTAGVRYDYHGGLTEKYGNMFNFDPATYSVTGDPVGGFTVNNGGFIVAHNNKYYPTSGVSDSTLTGRQWGISPRVGFAWAPRQNQGKIVFSGGAGMYFDRGELFSYLSQPAGGAIGGPFGATQAPPLVNLYQASGGTYLSSPLKGQTVTAPNANPAYFTSQLQSTLSQMSANCGAINNQANYGDGCVSPFSFGAYDRANKLPYTMNFNFKMQWQPVNDVAITLGYTGNRGRHAVIPVPFNEPTIATASNPVWGQTASYGYQVLNADSVAGSNKDGNFYNPISTEPWDTADGGNVDFRTPYVGYSPNAALFKTAGVSSYDGLESHLEKRLSHNVSAGLSYTWSHALDEQSDIGLFFTGNNPNNLHQSWASADFDRTQVFSANFQASLPDVARKNSLLSYAVNGWNLTGLGTVQSGEPYSLYEFYGAVGSLYFGNYPTLANPVLPIKNGGNPKAAKTGNVGAFRTPGKDYIPAIDPSQIDIPYINPGEKGIPACTGAEPCDYYETDFSTGQRNIFRQTAQKRLDLSLRKTFTATDHVKVQYEFNVFNVTNTSSFDVPMNQAEIGQAYVGDENENYGQVAASTNSDVKTIQKQLYVLPKTSGSGTSTTVTGSQIGSVLGTIGSNRIVTMGIHITY